MNKLVLILLLSLTSKTSFSARKPKATCQESIKSISKEKSVNLFKFKTDDGSYSFNGLTKEGRELFLRNKESLIKNINKFNTRFKNMSTAYESVILMRLYEGHAFIYGGPGGGKSKLLSEFIKNEDPNKKIFQIQLNKMDTEQIFIGGEVASDAKKGKYTINSEGSAADSEIVIVDEIDKSIPAVLTPLFGLMQEGVLMVGGKEVKAKTKSVFTSSNANPGELFLSFKNDGMESSAAALLNRFQVKIFINNWLRLNDQNALDKVLDDSFGNLNSIISELFSKNNEQNIVDWEYLNDMATVLFEVPESLIDNYIKFINEYRIINNEAKRSSDIEYNEDPFTELFPKIPTADLSERLRGIIPQIIKTHALLELIKSPLSNKDNLEKITSKKIVLGRESLWRSFNILTTVMSGETKLNYDKEIKKFSLIFDGEIDKKYAVDERELKTMEFVESEKERFVSHLESFLNDEKSNKNSFERKILEAKVDND